MSYVYGQITLQNGGGVDLEAHLYAHIGKGVQTYMGRGGKKFAHMGREWK